MGVAQRLTNWRVKTLSRRVSRWFRMSYTNRGFDTEVKTNGEHVDRLVDGFTYPASCTNSNNKRNQNDNLLPKICVIGSGDFGRALASRLAKSGYTVTIASRDISRNRDLIPAGVGVCDINEVSSADVVLVAIPFTFYSTLPVHLLTNKIVVDVSNRNRTRRAETEESQAEHLARILPASRVVKSFNVPSLPPSHGRSSRSYRAGWAGWPWSSTVPTT